MYGSGSMQIVYIDVFVLLNIFEDFLLLLCVKRITHAHTTSPRLIAASAAGGLLSLLSLCGINGFIINIVITALTAAAITLIAFRFSGWRLYIRTVLTLLAASFLFSGAMIFFYLALKPSGMMIINNRAYFNISPVLLIILTLVIYAILFLFNRFFRNRSSPLVLRNVRIYYSDKELCVKCKTDTGMNVREPFSGCKVIIIKKSLCDGFIGTDEKFRVIPFNSLGGSGMILSFKADRVELDGIQCAEELYIGMSENEFNADIDGLIPSEISMKKDGNNV
jgi:stage II sporulation protein GA (sporulation sigma-E factor processing peptidase)